MAASIQWQHVIPRSSAAKGRMLQELLSVRHAPPAFWMSGNASRGASSVRTSPKSAQSSGRSEWNRSECGKNNWTSRTSCRGCGRDRSRTKKGQGRGRASSRRRGTSAHKDDKKEHKSKSDEKSQSDADMDLDSEASTPGLRSSCARKSPS